MRTIILLILCSMLLMSCANAPKQITSIEYIYPSIPDEPIEPVLFPVSWFKVGGSYCVDAQGAKNLLKNKELQKSYIEDYKLIYEGIKKEATNGKISK